MSDWTASANSFFGDESGVLVLIPSELVCAFPERKAKDATTHKTRMDEVSFISSFSAG
jgi:hypothetical protein